MVKIDGLRLSPGEPISALKRKAAKRLRIKENDFLSFAILRRSLDAREAPIFLYRVAAEVKDELSALRRGGRGVSLYAPEPPYELPSRRTTLARRPVVIGAGPAGLFAALVLARAGRPPILLERGQPVETRRQDVETFRRTGKLNPDSNAQFGEGGAGTFSDGKLNTGTRDPRHRFILSELAAHGAPPDILIDAQPHVGTDYLFRVIRNLREELLSLGAEIRFGHAFLSLESDGGRLSALEIRSPDGAPYRLECDRAILAIGHSARDTFQTLHRLQIPMEAKAFAVGVRIEHRQSDCDAAQYRECAGNPALPASSYKLSCHLPDGRGVFSFCVCPGGEVIAAASEAGRVVTNGMSAYARDGENVNGGLLVGVGPSDFGGSGPLAGIEFQRELEEAAYRLGGGNYFAPVQRVQDFLSRRPSDGPGKVNPTYRPGVTWTDLHDGLPPFISDALAQAIPILGRKLKGYDDPDAVLTAVESRSSSPVRILRGASCQSALRGLYPCGEGAGYAGGILSAAADGIRCAESLCADAP